MLRIVRLLIAALAFTLLAANSASAITAVSAEKPASGLFGSLEQRIGIDALASSDRVDENLTSLYDFVSDFPVAARGGAGAAREATGFLGSRRAPLANAPYQPARNVGGEVAGRQYSGHAFDQMQNRGIMPSVVDNAIRTGTPFPTRAGTTGYYDAVNSLRVITDSASGRVVTVIPGVP